MKNVLCFIFLLMATTAQAQDKPEFTAVKVKGCQFFASAQIRDECLAQRNRSDFEENSFDNYDAQISYCTGYIGDGGVKLLQLMESGAFSSYDEIRNVNVKRFWAEFLYRSSLVSEYSMDRIVRSQEYARKATDQINLASYQSKICRINMEECHGDCLSVAKSIECAGFAPCVTAMAK